MAIQVIIMSLDEESFEPPTIRLFDKNEITVGRTEHNDLVLDRPEVSSTHAKLHIGPNGGDTPAALYITDLGSSNGTTLENNSLQPDKEMAIRPNQRIVIGRYLIKPSIVTTPQGKKEEEKAKDESKAAPSNVSTSGAKQPVVEAAAPEASPAKPDSIIDSFTGALSRAFSSPAPASPSVPPQAPTPAPISAAAPATPAAALETAAPTPAVIPQPVPAAPIVPVSTPRNDRAPASNTPQDASVRAATTSFVVFVDGSGQDNLDFNARKLFTFGGKVTHKGKGLTGVRIEAGDLGECKTGDDGMFSLGKIPEGTDFQYRATKEGFTFNANGIGSGKVANDIDLSIIATQLFEVRGTAVHREEPLSNVEIDGGALGKTTTNSKGAFSFSNVPEGTNYKLVVAKSKFVFEKSEFSGTAGPADASLAVVAKELFALRGRVLHNGTPMAGVQVEGGPLGTVSTAADGSYCFENVAEGTEYVLTASKDGFVFGTVRGKQSNN